MRARFGVAALVAGLLWPGAALAQSASAAAASAGAPAARPLLWRIELEPPSYLFGTIHVPDPRVLEFPPVLVAALEQAAVLYTEIPLDPELQQRALGAMQLGSGETLEAVLPAPLLARAQRFLEQQRVPLALFRNQKIWVLATLLPMLKYIGAGPPLDQQLFFWAQQHGVRTAGLETLEMQVRAMEAAGRAGELALLRSALDYVEKAAAQGRDPLEQMIALYLAGDEDRIAEHAFAYVDRSDPALGRVLDALIDRRNDYMARQIERRLAAEPALSHFFAVGAMHYPGPRGILAQLRAQGLRVVRVEAQSGPAPGAAPGPAAPDPARPAAALRAAPPGGRSATP